MTALRTVPLDQIRPSLNARGRIGDVDELALSLKVLGLQKPLLVIELADGYQILDGHRRHAAALKAGLREVEVIVRTDPGEAGRLQAQLAMEAHAKRFDPMSEARALHTLMFKHGLNREQISRTVGKTPAWVRDRISLVHLTPGEQASVQDGRLSVSLALNVLKARRDERDGVVPVPGGTKRHPNQAAQAYRVPHFVRLHPLAAEARERCASEEGHAYRASLNDIACGECWEAVIREDALAAAVTA